MSDIPTILEINEIKLYNTEKETEKQIKKIDFEGNDIWEHADIEERRKNGWIIQGLEAVVQYDEEIFTIAFSGGKMMSYAKVEGAIDYSKGQKLMDELRERFMDSFRFE